jgi:signal transduction histidine kinase
MAPVTKSRFDFSALCDSVCLEFDGAVKDKNLALLRANSSPAPVYGDKNRIKQGLVNLIATAIAYTGEGIPPKTCPISLNASTAWTSPGAISQAAWA